MTSLIPEKLEQPGTHALVIGVSAYEFLPGGNCVSPQGQELGIGQLSAAARSASEFAAWLLEDYRRKDLPLSSLRVALSPAPTEEINPSIKALLTSNSQATRSNVECLFEDFMDAAKIHKENVVIVYVAGHGVQFSKSGAVLLLNDFADPGHRHATFKGSVDMRAMHEAMNHKDTAQTQFWFIDACRGTPSVAIHYEKLVGTLEGDIRRDTSAQASPIFLSASPGQSAFARPNNLTLFCEALLSGLKRGNAARSEGERGSPWCVSVNTLLEYLPEAVKALAYEAEEEQFIEITGTVKNAVFHECSAPPDVDLTISIRPGLDSSNYTANLKHRGAVLYSNHSAWPLKARVAAGLYTIEVATLVPPSTDEDCLNLQPPSREKELPL